MADVTSTSISNIEEKNKPTVPKTHFERAKEYRARAKIVCKPMSNDFAIAYIVFAALYVIILTFSFIPYVGIPLTGLLILAVAGPCSYSQLFMNKQAKEGIAPEPGDAFFGFAHFFRTFSVTFIHALIIICGLIFLIIPGVYFYCNYSMSEIVCLEDDKIPSLHALKKSRLIMRGHRRDYFCLMLTYIGWILLSILTIGILFLWTMPKINAAKYEFYLDITKDSNPVIKGDKK